MLIWQLKLLKMKLYYSFNGTEKGKLNWSMMRNENEGGLHFLGLCAMIDPPNAGALEVVLRCQSADIKAIMVTGDYIL